MNDAYSTWWPIGEIGGVTGNVCGLDCDGRQGEQQEGQDWMHRAGFVRLWSSKERYSIRRCCYTRVRTGTRTDLFRSSRTFDGGRPVFIHFDILSLVD